VYDCREARGKKRGHADPSPISISTCLLSLYSFISLTKNFNTMIRRRGIKQKNCMVKLVSFLLRIENNFRMN